MKTPEQMAEEYTKDWWGNLPEAEGMRKSARENFLAGYQAAKDELADAGKVIDTCEHILDMEKMVDVNPSSGWISVKERLPEDADVVLIAFGGGVSIACYGGDWRHPVYPMSPLLSVTHWMPLPKPPEAQ